MDGTLCKVEKAERGSPYVQLVGCVAGVAGSLLAYTLWENMLLALLVGLVGIVVGVVGSKGVLRMVRH
jgi:1,4-dihydroxy-2-naphthoate octaprenyltransferase